MVVKQSTRLERPMRLLTRKIDGTIMEVPSERFGYVSFAYSPLPNPDAALRAMGLDDFCRGGLDLAGLAAVLAGPVGDGVGRL